jgi:fucose 4-O-acetylase-like acetyltransferase
MNAIARATDLATATPTDRNRAIDFLRAVSIVLVVFGHWLVAAPWIATDGGLVAGQMLQIAPWTRWLTSVFQVMPLFFAVGGFANAASWRSAWRRGSGYGTWVAGRLRRLLVPVLPLLAAWALIAVTATAAGVAPAIVRTGSQVALVPVWFLAVYIGVTMLAPPALAMWERHGWLLFVAIAGLAAVTDGLALGAGWSWVGWGNFVWVWLAAHLLGFAWRDERLPSAPFLVGAGLAALGVMLGSLGYPLSMVGVPGDAVTNTFPPTAALIALGLVHIGLARLVLPRIERWLERPGPWTATVLVNGSIMTVYLWHLTAMVLLAGGAVLLGGVGLHMIPGTALWWSTRPVWLLANVAAALPIVALAAPIERWSVRGVARSQPVLVVCGALFATMGLTAVALDGVVAADGGVRWWAIALSAAGAGAAGILGHTQMWGPRKGPTS